MLRSWWKEHQGDFEPDKITRNYYGDAFEMTNDSCFPSNGELWIFIFFHSFDSSHI